MSDAFELKDIASVKIDSYEIKMEKVLSRKSPKKVIVSNEKNKKKPVLPPEEKKVDKKPEEKKVYNFSASLSQDSSNSKSNNIWDFLDDILEEDKKRKENSSKIPEIAEKFELEEHTETDENKKSFPKRKPVENIQKSFEKLEDYFSSGKKLKCDSPFGKLDISDTEKEKHMTRMEMRMSQMQQKNENSQDNSKLKRLKKFVAEKREETAKHSVTKMQTQVKPESSDEPCSICLSNMIKTN